MDRRVWLVAGLAYGDEGKGATVHYLCQKHKADLVVRYNGGAQAGHNVVLPDGKHHTFSQFGSGTFIPGVNTYLSRFMLIEPMAMMREAEHLESLGIKDAWLRLYIDDNALVITPFQRAYNRLVENWRRYAHHNEHGSCGIGIGRTREDHLKYGDKVLFAKDLKNKIITREKLQFIRNTCRMDLSAIGVLLNGDLSPEAAVLREDWPINWTVDCYDDWPAQSVASEIFHDMAQEHQAIVFEGAQGMLLDEKYGQAPYNTWTDITFNNAYQLLAEADYKGHMTKVGVVRSYFTRHGAGPFKTEMPTMNYPEPHNSGDGFQGKFRQGQFDIDAVRYSVNALGGIDVLALNHLDRCSKGGAENLINWMIDTMHVNYVIAGFGPTADHRISGRDSSAIVDAWESKNGEHWPAGIATV